MGFKFPKKVNIVEVGLRDGLQNIKQVLPTETKLELLNLLSSTGLTAIEVSSFVRSDKIPQLADAELLYSSIDLKKSIHYPALVPNVTGLLRAINSGVKSICVFTAVSETFNQKNINCTLEQSLYQIERICKIARQKNVQIRGYISCVFGCPYEGKIAYATTRKYAQLLLEFGCYQIALGDTIGIATPGETLKCIQQLKAEIPLTKLAMHFHNTYGQALANILVATGAGVTTFDASICGLGGCPYAQGASGNIATEDLIYMLNSLGIVTGVDLNQLLLASAFVKKILPDEIESNVVRAKLSGFDSNKPFHL